MLFPVAPALGAVFSLSAVVLTLINISWRLIPHNWKVWIKGLFNLDKPEQLILRNQPNQSSGLIHSREPVIQEEKHHRIFACCDYSTVVKGMDFRYRNSLFIDNY